MGILDTTLIITKQIVIMFVMVGLGFALVKTGFLTQQFNQGLSRLLLYIIMPCLLVSSFQIEYDPATAKRIGSVLALSILVQGIGIAAGRALFGKKTDIKSRVAKIGVGYCNCGFMGLPLLQAILGPEGVIYASVFIIIFNVATWTHSYAVLRGGKMIGEGRPLYKVLLVPNIVAAVVGLALYFLPFRLPEIILSPLEYIGASNTPLAMLVLGGFLAEIDLKRAFSDRAGLLSYFGRLIVCPAVTALVLILLPVGEAAQTAMFIISAMPASTSLGLMAAVYDADGPFGAQVVAVSTLLSAVTIPLMTGAYFALRTLI